jgi:hypothetical protein
MNEDYFGHASRLALELECLLLETRDTAAVSKWWDSAHEALAQWRQAVRAMEAAIDAAQPEASTALEQADDHAHICFKLAEQYKSDPVLFAALTDAAAIIRDLMRGRLQASKSAQTAWQRGFQQGLESNRGLAAQAKEALRKEREAHENTNKAMTDALLMMEEREQRDEALLRQALEALLGQRGEPDWHTGKQRENAIAALRERLGDKA